tara:strand:- start:22709 stop:23644 length:936 start_codon:yes stop_codon:yes gene_type:complete
MTKYLKNKLTIFSLALGLSLFISCKETITSKEVNLSTTEDASVSKAPKKQHTEEFKKYWYAGKAEITSYTLQQSRYGEVRNGSAVLIYVTEPFSAEKQVKADRPNPNHIPVLKLNSTKNYITGIYPYSIMTSIFYPVGDHSHALKASFSAQEWCGQVYAQLNNKEKFDIVSFSYFESEGDQEFSLDKTYLEDEIWSKIRVNPSNLPLGEVQIIPSFEYIRVYHKEMKAQKAFATLKNLEDELSSYSIHYTELKRTLTIQFTTQFPYSIERWIETSENGTLISSGQKKKRIITPYWEQNKNSDLFLRDSLGL